MRFKLFSIFAILFASAAFAQNPSTHGNIVSGAATCQSSNCVYYQLPPNTPYVVVTISGTWSGTIAFQSISAPNANYSNLNSVPWTNVATEIANGNWSVSTGGATFLLIQAPTWSSGSAQVSMFASQTGSPMNNPVFPGTITATGLQAPDAGSPTEFWQTNGGHAPSTGCGISGACPISAGGTGATTVAAALSNLAGNPAAGTYSLLCPDGTHCATTPVGGGGTGNMSDGSGTSSSNYFPLTNGTTHDYTPTSPSATLAVLGAAPAITCTTVSSLSPANNGCYNLSTSSSAAMPAASAFTIFKINTQSGATATLTGVTLSADAGCSGYLSGTTLAVTGNQSIVVQSDGTNIWATCAGTATDPTKLPLTGGTLTGALNGTSASFSGNVAAGTTVLLSCTNNASIDSPAIANAISNMPANGGTLYLNSGTCITAEIILPDYPKVVNIIGVGPGPTILQASAANTPIMRGPTTIVPGPATPTDHFSNFAVQANASGSTGPAIDGRNMTYFSFDHISYLSNSGADFASMFTLDDSAGSCYHDTFDWIIDHNQTGPAIVFNVLNTAQSHWFNNVMIATDNTHPYVLKVFNFPPTAGPYYIDGMKIEGVYGDIVEPGSLTFIKNSYYESVGGYSINGASAPNALVEVDGNDFTGTKLNAVSGYSFTNNTGVYVTNQQPSLVSSVVTSGTGMSGSGLTGNIFPYSTNLNTHFNCYECTKAASPDAAPDGSFTAARITFITADYTGGLSTPITLVAGQTYMVSGWYKTVSGSPTFTMFWNAYLSYFPFTAISTWQRFHISFVASTSGPANFNVVSDAAGTAQVIDVWGVQLINSPTTAPIVVPMPYVQTTGTPITLEEGVVSNGAFISAYDPAAVAITGGSIAGVSVAATTSKAAVGFAGTTPVVTYTLGATTTIGAGATASCSTGYVCDQFSGTISLVSGIGTTSAQFGNPAVTITFPTTRTNRPTCLLQTVDYTDGGTVQNVSAGTSTATLAVYSWGSTAFNDSRNYTVSYICGGI
jgi:hypothetical protein